MPITASLRDHDLYGPAFEKGYQQGFAQGLEEALEKSRQRQVNLLRRLLIKRFGSVPAWLEQRLTQSKIDELPDLGERILDARSVEDLRPAI